MGACASTQNITRAGTFDKDRAEQQVGAARAEVDALKGTAYVPRTSIATVQDLLGISEDLSAEGLLVKASLIHRASETIEAPRLTYMHLQLSHIRDDLRLPD